MNRTIRKLGWACVAFCTFVATARASPVVINFDDVSGSFVDITNRYAGLTLNAIANPFPLAGTFPSSAAPPATLGGVQTWTDGFASATSPSQVAVAAPTATTGNAGDGGILMTFGFDINFLSLVGNDLGGIGSNDDESVTLTAWDAAGNLLGQAFSNTNLAGSYDQTPASIAYSGMRYVAFNYTDTQFGFYAIDDLTYDADAQVPEPGTMGLMGLGLLGCAVLRKRWR